METIQTLYGNIPQAELEQFCEVAGYKYDDGSWVVLSDEVEYYQLVNPGSTVEEKRYAKKLGWLTIRDLNFQYAITKTKKLKPLASGGAGLDNDVVAAIKYAKEKLFENNKPVYLPEKLAYRSGNLLERSYSYSSILK